MPNGRFSESLHRIGSFEQPRSQVSYLRSLWSLTVTLRPANIPADKPRPRDLSTARSNTLLANHGRNLSCIRNSDRLILGGCNAISEPFPDCLS